LNRIFHLIVLCVLMASACAARDRGSFEYRIPPGWHVRNAEVSESGLTALVIWQNVPNDRALKGDFASRLLLFDKAGRPVCDLKFDNPRSLWMTRDDRVILEEGNEGVDRITVFDARGRRLFETPTWRRNPVPALLGKEIGLWNTNGPFSVAGTWEISIIDGDTGGEKFKFPLTVQGDSLFCGFLPIGEGGHYLVGLGTSVSLRTYLKLGADEWKIDDIGGSVVEIDPLDESHVAISYHFDDPERDQFRGGVAVVAWRSGNVVFRQESRDPKNGLWSLLHYWGVNVRLEGADLLFFATRPDFALRVPRDHHPSPKWDITSVKKCRVRNFLKGDDFTSRFRYVVRTIKGRIHIEKVELEEMH
jgi:hypothetical protein